MVEAGDDRLSLSATDLDLSVTIHAAASVEAPGRLTQPVRKLTDAVRRGFLAANRP